MNQQREVIYSLRNDALDKGDMKERMMEMIDGTVEQILLKHCNPEVHADEWDIEQLQAEMQMFLLAPVEKSQLQGITHQELREKLLEITHETYVRREEVFGTDAMREIERRVLLAVIDDKWRDHLYEVDQLKAGIGLRAYAQKDPLLEYKHEAFTMFEELMEQLERDTARYLFRVMPARQQAPPPGARVASGGAAPAAGSAARGSSANGSGGDGDDGGGEEHLEPVLPGGGLASSRVGEVRENKADVDALGGGGAPSGESSSREDAARQPQRPVKPETFVRNQPKVGRNDPCPCGSGKKYKKCCGVND
jgi:preprotein translocase subunit SecA